MTNQNIKINLLKVMDETMILCIQFTYSKISLS